MENLGHYHLNGELTNRNAGFCLWGFGTKDTGKEGEEFFLKKFLSPKFPVNDTESSPDRIQKKIKKCQEFVDKKKAVYDALNRGSDGNDVRVRDFFRVNNDFWVVMDKVEALPWDIDTIVKKPVEEIRRLCAIVAHAIAGLHRSRLIHGDLKHENILYTQLKTGTVTAKVIDFDSSFLETAPPQTGEDVVGDLNYFSPEVIRHNYGEDVALTCKVDVFALGVLFHQYFTGALPECQGEKTYPGDAVLRGMPLVLGERIPADLTQLFQNMLQADPAQRPSAMEVFYALRGIDEGERREGPPPKKSSEGSFHKAGDLA